MRAFGAFTVFSAGALAGFAAALVLEIDLPFADAVLVAMQLSPDFFEE
jgi:hypothetical protein